jgi:phage tail sheath protein FI
LQAFNEVDEINIVCIPGITSQTVQTAMISHCENLKDRFCVLDPVKDADMGAIQDQKDEVVSDKGYAALYYPWIKVSIETIENSKLKLIQDFIPPSGYIAGIYARSDIERGVHKAPANEIIRGALEIKLAITKGEQDILNPLGINCIRAFPGRGIRIWGARTTASDPLWKYINVRRLLLYIEESIDEGTQWVVFEPNNEKLWGRVNATITQFLTRVWRDGALMGTKVEEAFFVKCDRTTMTQDDIDNGRLICMIGVAPVKPAEFVIFRIAQWAGGSAVTE